jgi:non-heme chloroperoxidase
MPTVEVNGARLEYWESGGGAPVVFVHGSLADMRSWHRQKVPFSRHYRAIGYSRRWHWPNAADDAGRPGAPLEEPGRRPGAPLEEPGRRAGYTAALHAEDLAALIRFLCGGRAHVVASSFGGYVALVTAIRHPELVQSLVLGEPPLFPWLPGIPGGSLLLDSFMRGAWEPAQAAFAAGEAENGIRFFLDAVLGPGQFDAMAARARDGILDNAAEMTREAASPDMFSPVTREEARTVVAPVLLLGGELSPPLFAPILAELERCLPRAERRTIPASSHSIHIENAAAYNEAVLDFLGRA